MAAIDPNLIKADAEELALLKQLYAPDASGIHQIRYGLTATDFNNGNLAAGLGTPPTVIAATSAEAGFIQSVFNRLAAIIRLRAEQVNSLSSALQFVSVERVRDDGGDPDVTGITYTSFSFEVSPNNERRVIPEESTITIEAELNDDAELNPGVMRTIVHEIGHSIGLKHYRDNPDDPSVSDLDTIMSYRVGGDRPATWFSEADQAALIDIYGPANTGDSGSGNTGTGGLTGSSGVSDRFAIDGLTGMTIQGFESGVDQLLLNRSLPGLASLKLKTVNGSRKTLNKKGLASSAPLVYWKTEGELILNSNGRKTGFGEGGILAELGALTPLASGDLSFG